MKKRSFSWRKMVLILLSIVLYAGCYAEFVWAETASGVSEEIYWKLSDTLESKYLLYIPDTSPGVKAVKSKKVKVRDIASMELKVEGEFKTQLAFESGRQMFSGIVFIDSSVIGGTGTYTQTGYSYQVIDGGRTYVVTVEGRYEIDGNSEPVSWTVEFYCSSVGRVS